MTELADLPKLGDTCLSVRQPYAELILRGIKGVENRSRPAKYRGRLWLHTSKRSDCSSWSDVLELEGQPLEPDVELHLEKEGITLPAFADLALGAVIGSIELYDCLPIDEVPESDEWALGPWCWMVRNPRPLAKSIPAKGALGLWKWK